MKKVKYNFKSIIEQQSDLFPEEEPQEPRFEHPEGSGEFIGHHDVPYKGMFTKEDKIAKHDAYIYPYDDEKYTFMLRHGDDHWDFKSHPWHELEGAKAGDDRWVKGYGALWHPALKKAKQLGYNIRGIEDEES